MTRVRNRKTLEVVETFGEPSGDRTRDPRRPPSPLSGVTDVSAFLGASPHDDLARGGCGERADGALHPIARTIALLGGDRVVVRRPWLEVIDAHAERRGRMALVQPDGIFRRLAQVLRICTVVHDAVMHVRPSRVVGRPPDDGQVAPGQLELGPSGDLDTVRFLGRRKYLRG